MAIAVHRTFTNGVDEITLSVSAAADDDVAGYRYKLALASSGEELDARTFFGEDDLQAFLFCLTAAGDMMAAVYPGYSWVGSGATGLLTSDRAVKDRWQASVWYPTKFSG